MPFWCAGARLRHVRRRSTPARRSAWRQRLGEHDARVAKSVVVGPGHGKPNQMAGGNLRRLGVEPSHRKWAISADVDQFIEVPSRISYRVQATSILARPALNTRQRTDLAPLHPARRLGVADASSTSITLRLPGIIAGETIPVTRPDGRGSSSPGLIPDLLSSNGTVIIGMSASTPRPGHSTTSASRSSQRLASAGRRQPVPIKSSAAPGRGRVSADSAADGRRPGCAAFGGRAGAMLSLWPCTRARGSRADSTPVPAVREFDRSGERRRTQRFRQDSAVPMPIQAGTGCLEPAGCPDRREGLASVAAATPPETPIIRPAVTSAGGPQAGQVNTSNGHLAATRPGRSTPGGRWASRQRF